MGTPSTNSAVSLLCSLILLGSAWLTAGYHDSAYSSLEGVIPPSLVIPKDNDVQQVLFATGIQIYLHNSTTWVLHNVSADLYSFKGLKIGYHYFLEEVDCNGGQATWETYRPATRVTGKRLSGVSQEDSIDWLLIEATSNSGTKFFSSTRFIQRLYTRHGRPPSAEVPAKEGDFFASNYTSLYTFYEKDASGRPSTSS